MTYFGPKKLIKNKTDARSLINSSHSHLQPFGEMHVMQDEFDDSLSEPNLLLLEYYPSYRAFIKDIGFFKLPKPFSTAYMVPFLFSIFDSSFKAIPDIEGSKFSSSERNKVQRLVLDLIKMEPIVLWKKESNYLMLLKDNKAYWVGRDYGFNYRKNLETWEKHVNDESVTNEAKGDFSKICEFILSKK